MSLINYVEPIHIGEIFLGLGGLFLCVIVGYIFYRIYIKLAQYLDVIYNREAKYEILEEVQLDAIAKAQGVDLNAELLNRKMLQVPSKSFRRKVEEQVYERMFGKEEKKE